MSKAGWSLLRTTMVGAAHTPHAGSQLARIYYVQMVERGARITSGELRGCGRPGRAAWIVTG